MPVGRKVSYVMAQFDKKDYAVIAGCIHEVVSSLHHAYNMGEPIPDAGVLIDDVVVTLVNMFAQDDDSFVAQDFVEDCGVTL